MNVDNKSWSPHPPHPLSEDHNIFRAGSWAHPTSALHNVHCTSALHSAPQHCIVCTSALHTAPQHCTLHTIEYCAKYGGKLYIRLGSYTGRPSSWILSALHSAHCTLCSAHCAVHTAQCIPGRDSAGPRPIPGLFILAPLGLQYTTLYHF